MMCAQPAAVPLRPEPESISVRLVSDPPGRTEIPARPNLHVAVHIGRACVMACRRAGQCHRGLGVHGDIDIIPAFTAAIWEPEDHDTALVVGLDTRLLENVASDLNIYPDRIEILNRFQVRDLQMESLSWALKAEMESGFPSGRLFRESVATALAACLLTRHTSISKNLSGISERISGRRLKQILGYIEENLSSDLSLSNIAAIVGLSASHLKTVFRQSMGMSLHQYVIQRRVEQARTLLQLGTLSISAVALETGFTHQSHMAAHMRRILGMSPRTIRDTGNSRNRMEAHGDRLQRHKQR